MTIERRKYVRFLVKGDMFAAMRNGFKKVGKVNDISINGMAFSYLSDIADTGFKSHDSKVDIFSSEKEFHLSNVPCRVVYEIKDVTVDAGLHVKKYKCGLDFGELSKMQLDLLNFLIKKYAIKTRPTGEIPKMLDNHVKMI